MDQLYVTLLYFHSYWRWVVLIAAVGSLVIAARGLGGRIPFLPLGRKIGAIFTGSLDLQLLLGLGLFFTSPIVKVAMANPSMAMKVKEMRFFLVEHATSMLIAVVLAHVGSVRAKRATLDTVKFKQMLIWNSLALVALLVGIPWWRPLFRM